MPDYKALKTELALAEYAALSDADSATHYNAKSVTAVQPISHDVFAKYLFDSGLYAILLNRSQDTDPTHATAKAVAQTLIDYLKYIQLPTLDTSTAVFQGGMAILTSLGDVTPQNTADLTALATVVTPYYRQPGQFGYPVSADDVHYARSL